MTTPARSSRTLIYKVCHRAEWVQAVAQGIYAGSAKDHEDHFIHFSAAHQLRETLERHYAGAEELVLVAVFAEALGGALRYEPSRGGELFPHLHGTLPLAFVNWARLIRRDRDGKFVLPDAVL